MSTSLCVPAAMVRYLRNGLYTLIGNAADVYLHFVSKARREQRPEWYREPLAQFDRARALLDLIGWDETGTAVDVHIDLHHHQQAVLSALHMEMAVAEADLQEAPTVDAERAGRGEPPQRDLTIQRVSALREFVASVEAQVSRLGLSRFPATVYAPTELGYAVRTRRRELKLTKEQVADLAGIHPEVLRELERGRDSIPLRVMLPVVNTLGFSIELRPRRGAVETLP